LREELERLVRFKAVYETQIKNLKKDWKDGTSNFCKFKDYKIQLKIWEKRITQYEEEIEKLKVLNN
jgi:hypothetical protein